jgi:flagellar hook-associated protein 3 FlgL
VSDDPDQISTLLAARARLSSAEQLESNLGRIQAEVDAGEQALQRSVELFERVRSLGAQAATSTSTPATRNTLAQEVGSILQQLAGLASTQVEGRFIFSGDADQLSPYLVDLSLPAPMSAYLGAPATRLAQHANGTTFRVGLTAQEIFDASDPAANVFQAVAALRQAMLDNDEAAIQAAVSGLSGAGDHLNNQLAFYGTTQNKILEAHEFGQTLQLQVKSQIASIEDADLSQAILELNQTRTQQDAALNARARMPQTSLFDFLA